MRSSLSTRGQHGSSLIEVMVTVVILTFGLLGLAGMQSRLQQSEMEAYQRSQALILLDDMANRIATNRTTAASYVTSNPLGTGNTCTFNSTSTRQVRDSCEWSNALTGAAETSDASSGSSSVGAMLGGRGCVESLGNNEYMITVAWQGKGPISAPPSSISCGQNLYNGGTVCVNDLCRRTLTTIVRIAILT